MSRVDEALNRARGRIRVVEDAPPPTSTSAVPLAQYPVENRSAVLEIPTTRAAWSGPMPTEDPSLVSQCARITALLSDAQAARGIRTVMITGVLPAISKTRTALNVALALSHVASHVLLIEADMKQPSLGQLLGVQAELGLSDMLRAGRPELPIIDVSLSLSVLLAGPPECQPLPMLLSDRMRQLVEACAAQFEWVLLDVPPAGATPDAHTLAGRVDGVVFIIGAASPFRAVEAAIAQMGRDRLIGTMLTGLNP